jgi:phosphatidylserine decarboxylase
MMGTNLPISYVDRTSGAVVRETVYAGGFLRWLYNTVSGKMASYLIFRHPLASRLYGWWTRQRWSRRMIAALMRLQSVTVSGLTEGVDAFQSFNDFFTRRIDLSHRPVAADQNICIAPVDGKVLAYKRTHRGDTLQIKQHSFNLDGFLRDRDLAATFDGGSVVICRLSLADYHHFHFPDSGWPGRPRIINGSLYASGPYARRETIPYYAESQRMLTRFLSDHFRLMLIVEVGALAVGSIRQEYQPGKRVDTGDHKGHFELGGSTVVLLFQRNTIEIDSDLLLNTARGLETYVRMGEPLGRAACSQSYTDLLKEAI